MIAAEHRFTLTTHTGRDLLNLFPCTEVLIKLSFRFAMMQSRGWGIGTPIMTACRSEGNRISYLFNG
jgi:hypothetical protein